MDIATLAIEVDTTDLNRLSTRLNDVEGRSSRTERRVESLSRSMAGFAKVAGAAGLALGAVFTAVGAKSIAMASDLEETQGKFDVVFRGMTKDAEEWSTNLQKSYAMSETESKKFLSNIQDLIVPTGLAREESAKLSNQFVKMAADLGSFNNLPTEQVIRDIQSALAGGSETLTKYGINVKVAQVRQEALNMGIIQGKEELTSAQRVGVLYNIMMKEGADAVGDMERTQGSYANQLKRMQAQIANLTTDVGKVLLPEMNKLVTSFNEWWTINGELITQDISGFISGIVPVLSKMLEVTGNIGRSFAGWSAVSEGKLDFLEFATMSAKEMSEWIEKDSLGLVDIDNKLERLRETAGNIRFSLFDGGKGSKAQKQAIQDEISVLELQREVILNLSDVIREDYTDSWMDARTVIEDTADGTVDSAKKVGEAWETTFVSIASGWESFQAASTKTRDKIVHDQTFVKDEIITDWDAIDSALEESFGEIDAMSTDTAWNMAEQFNVADNEIASSYGSTVETALLSSFGKTESAWGTMLNSMLAKLASVVVEMAVTWAASSVATTMGWEFNHDGLWNTLKADEFPHILQDREMIVPQGPADQIRQNLGGFDGSFDSLVDATAGGKYSDMDNWDGEFGRNLGNRAMNSLIDVLTGTIMGNGAGAMANAVSMSSLTEMVFGAFTDAKINEMNMGVDQPYSDVGGFVAPAATIMGLGGAGSPFIGGALKFAGAWAGDRFGDAVNDRNFESILDAVEDGFITREAAISSIQNMTTMQQRAGMDNIGGSSLGGIFGSIGDFFSPLTSTLSSMWGGVRSIAGLNDDGSRITQRITSDSLINNIMGANWGQPSPSASIFTRLNERGQGNNVGGALGTSTGTGGGFNMGGGQVSGLAGGGTVGARNMLIPSSDDGLVPMALGEGVLKADDMKILSELIRSGNIGGAGNIVVKVFLGNKEIKALIDHVTVTKARQGTPSTERVYI